MLLLCNWKQNQAFYLLLDYGTPVKTICIFFNILPFRAKFWDFFVLFLFLLTTLGTEGSDCAEHHKMVSQWWVSGSCLQKCCAFGEHSQQCLQNRAEHRCSCEAMPASLSVLLLLGMTPRMFPVVSPTLWPSVEWGSFAFFILIAILSSVLPEAGQNSNPENS